MTYDQWKLASPDDERYYDDDPDPEFCDHSEYEIDWEGRAECHLCGESWWASPAQVRAQHEFEAEYFRACERDVFRARWLWWWDWPIGIARGWLSYLTTRRPKAAKLDDEIPF